MVPALRVVMLCRFVSAVALNLLVGGFNGN
jgi:hypothetical protein